MSRRLALFGALVVALCMSCYLSSVAFGLAGGRTFEMVSPVYKGGYGATAIEGVALNGESVAFFSPGAFAGEPTGGPDFINYVASRGTSGWSTAPVAVPAAMMPHLADQDISPTLSSMLALGKPGPTDEAAFQFGSESEFLLHPIDTLDTEANWELGGVTLKTLNNDPFNGGHYYGGSKDFCHLLFYLSSKPLLLAAVEAADPTDQVYELNRGCEGDPPSLRLVGVNNADRLINPACPVDLGLGQGYGRMTDKVSQFNAIAAGGDEVFFTVNVEGGSSCKLHQLFVRLGDSKTLEVSKPVEEACRAGETPEQTEEVPCEHAAARASAEFVGASEDGSKVFFTTTAQLSGEDKDVGNDLYMATIGCPSDEGVEECNVAGREVRSLVQVSHEPTGGAAEVQGTVVRVSQDGSRVYFVAHGVLTEEPNSENHMPLTDADNLYVYDSTSGKVAFITDLCSGSTLSGEVEDLRCPSKNGNDTALWLSSPGGEAQTAGLDGRFLVFSSYGQLVANDTDTAKDIYRYDSENGTLDRVSIGEDGSSANGNNSLFEATILPAEWGGTVRGQYELRTRAISEDGSRIVFNSTEALSANAVNGLANVYEWHKEPGEIEGKVSLVSTGSSIEPVENAVISSGGDDVFFLTVQGLVPQDTDGAPDIYDARLHGGFPAPAAPRQPCSGDACQGPLTNPAPLLVPGSVSQLSGENVVPTLDAADTLKTKKEKPAAKKNKSKNKKRVRRVNRQAKRATHTRRR